VLFRSRPLAGALAASWLAALCACGLGHSQQGPAEAGAGDDGGGAPGGPCPDSLPNAGAPCDAPASVLCEYGDDVNGGCNRVAACSRGEWSLTGPSPAATCPTPTGDPACPTSYRGVARGALCDIEGLICGYPQGICECLRPISGPPQVGPGGANPTWACDLPQQGCPSPRPHLGTACGTEGQTCDYASCTLPEGTAETCSGGVWTTAESACPL
jgi:hypothetical protein